MENSTRVATRPALTTTCIRVKSRFLIGVSFALQLDETASIFYIKTMVGKNKYMLM